ncbi:hypothetical protein [Luteococcus sanguinis]|uniref:Uncharacterized protein n=1 Tax=Luteococcus sanguinis TaxID=174038 RepID=A0ABW1X026_9ACTN
MTMVTTANTPAIRRALLGGEAKSPALTRPSAQHPAGTEHSGSSHATVQHASRLNHAKSAVRQALRG